MNKFKKIRNTFGKYARIAITECHVLFTICMSRIYLKMFDYRMTNNVLYWTGWNHTFGLPRISLGYVGKKTKNYPESRANSENCSKSTYGSNDVFVTKPTAVTVGVRGGEGKEREKIKRYNRPVFLPYQQLGGSSLPSCCLFFELNNEPHTHTHPNRRTLVLYFIWHRVCQSNREIKQSACATLSSGRISSLARPRPSVVVARRSGAFRFDLSPPQKNSDVPGRRRII